MLCGNTELFMTRMRITVAAVNKARYIAACGRAKENLGAF